MRFIKFQAQVEPYGTHFVRAKAENSAQGLVFRCRSYHRTNFGTLCVQTDSGTHYAHANSRNSASWYSPLARAPSQTSARFACSFLYPFQRLRKRKLNGVVLAVGSCQFKKLGTRLVPFYMQT